MVDNIVTLISYIYIYIFAQSFVKFLYFVKKKFVIIKNIFSQDNTAG